MSSASVHPLWQELAAYLLGLPVMALLLHGFGRGVLAALGLSGRKPITRARLAGEWGCVLAALYLYVAYSALFPHRW